MSIPTVRLYLDKRRVVSDNLAPVKIALCRKGKVAYINTQVRVKPSQWDAKAGKVIRHPFKTALTDSLHSKLMQVDGFLAQLSGQGRLADKTIVQIKDEIEDCMDGTDGRCKFMEYFHSFCEKKQGRTKEIYEATLKRLGEYGHGVENALLEEITPLWLQDFDTYLSVQSPSRNARNIHLRNIRAVFNDAIKNDITSHYPFKHFLIKGEQTAKRSLSLEQLQQIFSIRDSKIQYEIDMFKLMFLLIGINLTDLFNLETLNGDRIEYVRAKTHKCYSIKVEPEAMEIINRHKGNGRLLDIVDRHASLKAFKTDLDRKLKRVFPKLSSYWARHSWATIAADLDIPIETIAHALGHSYGSEVTNIYIRFNEKKVDEANRRVIDYVLNKSKTNNI